MYRMFAGTQPEDSLRMMPRTLDRIDRIKQVEEIKRLVAPRHPADLSILLEPVVYLAAEMDVGVGKSCSENRVLPEL